MPEIKPSNLITSTSNVIEVSTTTLNILTSEIERKDSSLDFPVIDSLNRMMLIGSPSGVGLLMLFLETFEILMNPNSEITDSNFMKFDVVDFGDETFLIVMLLFEEIGADNKIVIESTTERSWIKRWQFVIGEAMVIDVVDVPARMESEISKMP